MSREELLKLIALMEIDEVVYETHWYCEEPIINYLKNNNNDKEIFSKILKYDLEILDYAGNILKDDKDFMAYAVKEWGKDALFYGSDRIKDDETIVIEAIKYKLESFSHTLEFASERIRNNIEIVKFAMNCCYDPDTFDELQFASNEIRSNKNFILNQLDIFTSEFDNPVFLKYISADLKNDAEFVNKLMEINPNSEKYLK